MKLKKISHVVGFISSRDALVGHRSVMYRGSKVQCTDSGDRFECQESNLNQVVGRRSLLHSTGASIAGIVSAGPLAKLLGNQRADVNMAGAMGLIQFPCQPGSLANTYHMMRAGESRLEAEGILSTNPLFLTNQDDCLSDLGKTQVEKSCIEMLAMGINPSVIKYSLASKCVETANIVASTLMVGRNRIVPEFTFMDQRSVGLWDGKPLNSTEAAVWAMDADEAGDEGRGGKPPPNDDGTPNESLFEQVTRLRQLVSILETQYSGDDILLIFPDGTSPALLSCLISGISLKDVHALNFSPGELRVGVNMINVRQLLNERVSSPYYKDILDRGRKELLLLRKEYDEYIVAKQGSKKLLVPGPVRDESEANRPRASWKRDQNNFSPYVVATGAFTVGGLALLKLNKEVDDETERTSEVMKSVADVTAELDPSSIADSIQSVAIVADSSEGMIDLNVFQDVPVLSEEERLKAAEIAMEEYLSQDDGSDAWLSSILEIRDEE